MKRLLLAIGMLAIMFPLTGCGSDSPPPADGSNLPDEVKDFETRRQTEREKKVVPKAGPPTSGSERR